MKKTLVIVESPTKAKTIAKFLGNGFIVRSSMGHVRDLPKNEMGVDIEGGTFLPTYEISEGKKKNVSELRKLAKEADDILFATDEDREGEAISWHLAELLKIKPTDVKRLVFHEITKTAIDEAMAHPRPLNINLVDAQQARRVLDRLVGYELSPLLWRKIRYGLSAGRVQSVAVHVLALREKERALFKNGTYFDLVATLDKNSVLFDAKLISLDNKKIPTGKDFDELTGTLKKPELFSLLDQETAHTLAIKLKNSTPWIVTSVEEKPYITNPYPPFITSTLQQEGGRKFGWGARETMRTAQKLYEKGYITYMRTDSINLSKQAIEAARTAALEFGQEYIPDSPRFYSAKSKLAQEAHEAIRPAGNVFKHPSDVGREVEPQEAKLYDLIWKRTVACQMKSASMLSIVSKISVDNALFETRGKQIKFAGYLRAYVEGSDDPESELEDREIILPKLELNEILLAKEVRGESHTTLPPARYTEASLIKKLESEGVGRPSTYASIIHTILERGYVVKDGNALIPTYTGIIVDHYLQIHFKALVDVHFTSKMEEDLDAIARGDKEFIPYIKEFYGKGGAINFHEEVEKAMISTEYPDIELGLDGDKKVIVKSGKFGPYVQRAPGGDGNTASIPDNLAPADLDLEMALKLIANKSVGPQAITIDPSTNLPITYRDGRYGPYLQLGEDGDEKFSNNKDKKAKKVGLTYGPKRTPLTSTIDITNISASEAIQLISLPRTLGELDGEEIIATNGRFGPFLKKGSDFRTIPKDKDLMTITLDDAKEIYAEEKKGRTTKKIIKDLGIDPKTEKPIQVLDGKYGPYISNGTKTFVSVPTGTKPEELTLERALELITAKKGGKKKITKKKTVTKKVTTKKLTKK